MRIALALLTSTLLGCSQAEPPDAGSPGADAGATRDAGFDAGGLCDQPTGSFVGCSTNCGLCVAEVAGYPLYALQNAGCAFDLFCSQPTRRACPTGCPPPSPSDRGTPAVFTLGAPFDAGPAVSSVLTAPLSTTLLSMPAGTRFVVVRPGHLLATCDLNVANGLVMLFAPSAGTVSAGRYPTSAVYQPPPGTVVATVNSSQVALDGSVTLTAIGATVSGTFDLVLGGASTSGGVVQGSFDAVPCTR